MEVINRPFDVRTIEQIVPDSVAGWRFSMLLLGVLAGLALVLAAVGIYGVISIRPRSARTRSASVWRSGPSEPTSSDWWSGTACGFR